jgi:hypothetical protein
MSFSWWDILAHSYNLLYLTAFLVKDLLWLRVLLCIASVLEVLYSYNAGSSPLWPNILWCSAYILANTYQFYTIYQERRKLFLTEEERRVYLAMFSSMPEIIYKRLLNISEIRQYPDKSELIIEGEMCKELLLITDGIVCIEKHGQEITRVRNPAFMGEMSFLSGNRTTATVRAIGTVQCRVWQKKNLQDLINKDHDLHISLQTVFSLDLTQKLTLQDK